MARGRIRHALHYLHGLFGHAPDAARPDRDLLESFAIRRDEAAFTALVDRHGPLVWGVCRRLLAHEQDAEDAFQATFLVLARKAGSISWRDDVGNWLYAVAVRVARKARGRALRQRQREQEAVAVAEAVDAIDPSRRELAELIDEEVGRLPEKYRRPVVLCCLQGMTYVEAARLLGWPEGTTSARLARAREMLRRRLIRRGLTLAVLPTIFVESVGAAPATLSEATVRNALAFVVGKADPGPVHELSEGVLRAMFHTKLKIGAAATLAIALLGVGIASLAAGLQQKEPEKKAAHPVAPIAKGKEEAKPALPKEWIGRWIANPFDGAEWIEVRHYQEMGPAQRVYAIKDPKTVAAIVKAAKVIGVQNDMAVGSIATSTIIVHYPGGKSFRISLDSSGYMSCDGGILHYDEGLFKALNSAASHEAQAFVDVCERIPAPKADVQPKPLPKASPKSLESGFSQLGLTFWVGRRLHRMVIDDAKTLTALHKVLVVLKSEPVAKRLAETRNMTVVCKDGAGFYFQIEDRVSMFDFRVGKFILTPAFFDALNKEVSKRAGFDVDVTAKDNPFPAKLAEPAQALKKVLGEVKSLKLVDEQQGNDIEVELDDPKQVAEIVGSIAPFEGLPRELKLKKKDRRVELTLKDGKKLMMTFLDTNVREAESSMAIPGMSSLVDVTGIGPVWVSDQWVTRMSDMSYRQKLEAKWRFNLETARLVSRDLPTFFKHVESISRREGPIISGVLAEGHLAKILAALAGAKFEKLDWTDERWQKELGDKDGGLELGLSPGLGFTLWLIVHGDRELYIHKVGRITFAESPLPAIRKVLDAEDAAAKDKPE